MFSENFPVSLVALRQHNFPLYVQLMLSQYPDHGARKVALGQISELMEKYASDAAEPALPNLTDMLASREYRAFVKFLNESSPDLAPKIVQVLENKEYEHRLRRLKEVSLGDYVNELRVVSEAELVSALEDGTIVNAVDEDGQPIPIRSDESYSAAFLERPTATAWLDAALLVKVLSDFASGKSEKSADPQGLRLRQVVVGESQLNLNWLDCPFPLGFEGCDFYHWISADYLKVPWLSFDSCDFTPHEHTMQSVGAFNAASIVVEHELRFWGCEGLGQLFIPDARIGSFSPVNPHQDEDTEKRSAEKPITFRTVIDGAHFGQFVIPRHADEEIDVQVSRSVRIEMLGGLDDGGTPREVARHVFEWLVKSESKSSPLPSDVWDQFEQALRSSNHAHAATEFGVAAAKHQTLTEGVKGCVKRLVLGPTVRYFYGNMRALGFLAGLFFIAWVALLCVALFLPDQLVPSPLANEAVVPEGWLLDVADKLVWSFLYAIDLVFSPISLGLASTIWPVSIWLSLLFAVIKGLSILSLGLFVVGVTGLVEKRSRA